MTLLSELSTRMSLTERRIRRRLAIVLGVTLGVATAFIALFVGALESGVGWHELAGLILLVLLVLALWPAVRLQTRDPRPLTRVIVALVCLIIAAAAGGSLAIGTLPPLAEGLPLVPLTALVLDLADGIRVTLRVPEPGTGAGGRTVPR
ncbi:MAG: hypothetical protein WCA77_00080 [Thermoplasmata archaeon]